MELDTKVLRELLENCCGPEQRAKLYLFELGFTPYMQVIFSGVMTWIVGGLDICDSLCFNPHYLELVSQVVSRLTERSYLPPIKFLL